MFKSRELSNLQQRVATLEKQLKAANGSNTNLEASLKAANAKVMRFRSALDNLHAAIAAKASEDGEAEPDGDEEEAPAGKKAKKAEGEEDAPADDEEAEPAAEGDEEDAPADDEEAEPAAEDSEEEDKTMKKSKASLALLNRIPGKASINKQVEKKAAKVVTSRLAAAGVDPVKRDPAASEKSDGKQKADASLPPRQRAIAAMASFKVFSKN